MRKRFAIAVAAALLVGWQVRATPEGVAELVSTTKWQQSEDWFGGFSGIEVQEDGTDFVAISDRGRIVQGQLLRDDGKIDGVQLSQDHPILGLNGQIQKRARRDTEGLAIRKDGRVFVSYEGNHRVWAYMSVGAQAAGIQRHNDFKHMSNNGSLEALAVDDDNNLYTIPEQRLSQYDGLPVYRYANGQWTLPFTIPSSGRYHPVGADFGPDGKFYLLERSFNGWGFRSRVRRFDITPNGADGEELLLQTSTGVHDNLEGLSVWRDADGNIRLTMISDDNFLFYQRTEIVEYRLPESA